MSDKGFQKDFRITYEDEKIIIGIEEHYSNDTTLYFKGWAIGKEKQIDNINLILQGHTYPIVDWHERQDIADWFSVYEPPLNCGFELFESNIKLLPMSVSYNNTEKIDFEYSISTSSVHHNFEQKPLYKEFINLVNKGNLSVLEIGARPVVHESRKSWFEGASEYVGFDYYDGVGVDIKGDAHKLSNYLKNEIKFDAVCSFFVLEHIAMPWLLAMEINKILKPGGITFHVTNLNWPMHELPWDFWRFTDQALKVLFSPPMGFRTIATSYSDPVRIYLKDYNSHHSLLPFGPAFGCVSVLAKKVSKFDESKLRFNISVDEVISTVYPNK